MKPWEWSRLTVRDLGELAEAFALARGASVDRRPSPQEKAQNVERLIEMLEAKRGTRR